MSEPVPGSSGIEISESGLMKLGGALATIAPVGLGVLQYVNDPGNIVGILICLVLFMVVAMWRQTQATVRELKAEVLLLRKAIDAEKDMHDKYRAISNNTIVNMFAQISRLAGERDAGAISLDKETGASIYVPPSHTPPPDGAWKRVTDPRVVA